MNESEKALSRRTPVYDHAGVELFLADRQRAKELMASQNCHVIATKKRIKGLRFRGPDVGKIYGGATCFNNRRRKTGEAHRRANYWNVGGSWHINWIPRRYRLDFLIVVLERTFEWPANERHHTIQ